MEEKFGNKVISAISQNDENQKYFSPAFFNILKEPLIVQKQTIHQRKAHDLSYLEPEIQGRGTIRRAPRLLGAKGIGPQKSAKWFLTLCLL